MARGVTALLVMVLSLGSAGAVRAESVMLRYGQTASTMRSVFSLPIFVAEREGFFISEGLAVTVVPISGGTSRMIAALDEGRVDVTHVSMPFLIQAVLAGADAVAIAGEFANPIYHLVARPGISSFTDLRGRVVGMAAATDMVAITTRKLLAKNGLASTSYRARELVGTPARVSCLEAGVCDAAPLGQPDDFSLLGKGYSFLGSTRDATPSFQYTVTAARRSWLAVHADTAKHYARALAAAFQFIRDPARRSAVETTIVETTGATADTAKRIMSLYLDPDRGVLPMRGELNVPGIAQVIADMTEAGAISGEPPAAKRFVDQRFSGAMNSGRMPAN